MHNFTSLIVTCCSMSYVFLSLHVRTCCCIFIWTVLKFKHHRCCCKQHDTKMLIGTWCHRGNQLPAATRVGKTHTHTPDHSHTRLILRIIWQTHSKSKGTGDQPHQKLDVTYYVNKLRERLTSSSSLALSGIILMLVQLELCWHYNTSGFFPLCRSTDPDWCDPRMQAQIFSNKKWTISCQHRSRFN